jgi:hypothetical protein
MLADPELMTSRNLLLVAFLLLAASLAAAVPFWGAKQSLPADTDPAALTGSVRLGRQRRSGQFDRRRRLARERRAYVYRNGIRIGVTTVSSGKAGHRTPTGISRSSKDADHRSKKYNVRRCPSPAPDLGRRRAPRGRAAGYRVARLCPPALQLRLLFQISSMGMVVVIADAHSPDAHLRHRRARTVDAATGADDVLPPLTAGGRSAGRLASLEGPCRSSSAAPTGVLVFRNGVRSAARRSLRDRETARRALCSTGAARPSRRGAALGRDRRARLSPEGRAARSGQVARVSLPDSFRTALRSVLAPGATLVVTDAAVLDHTTGVPMTIVTADPPSDAAGKAASEG